MLDTLRQKVTRLHASIDNVIPQDIRFARPWRAEVAGGIQFGIGTRHEPDSAELENEVYRLIANIACLKDHLDWYCKEENRSYPLDTFINDNQSVAIVHDLWNIDKHAKLSRPPRSGFTPSLRGLREAMVFSSSAAGETAGYVLGMTGALTPFTSGGGTARTVVRGEIVDENGEVKALLIETLENAITLWAEVFTNIGIPLKLDPTK